MSLDFEHYHSQMFGRTVIKRRKIFRDLNEKDAYSLEKCFESSFYFVADVVSNGHRYELHVRKVEE